MNDDVVMMGPAWWDLLSAAQELVAREGLQLDADARALTVALVMLDAVADAVQSQVQPLEPL